MCWLQIDGVTGREYKYEEIGATIRKVASGLYKLGVRKGDVLAIFSPNSPEYIFMFYGALANGASVTTINPSYTVCEYYVYVSSLYEYCW